MKRLQDQYTTNSERMERVRIAGRDALLHMAIIITVIAVTGIVLGVKYGVEIDLFCNRFLK